MGSTREHVFTSQGQDVGELVSLKDDFVHLRGKDFWLPVAAIESVDAEEVRLRPDYDYLSGPQPGSKARFVVSNATRMAILGMIARMAYSYRDERKRTQLISTAKEIKNTAMELTTKAKAELKKAKQERDRKTLRVEPVATRPRTDVPAFSTLDLSHRNVGVTELEVIAEVTRAFPESTVRTEAVGVHKADGREVGTLRFSVDERASSDIDLDRLESTGASAEVLAQEVISDLRAQMPSVL